MAEARTFRAAGSVATWARILLWLQAGLAALTAVPSLAGISDPLAPTDAQVLIVLAQSIAYLVCGVVVLRWLYLANNNAWALGAQDLMVTPGWAVGWWFIPFANLVMPYLTVREIWKASRNPRDWQAAPSSPILPLWWGLWIAAAFTGGVSLILSLEYDPRSLDTAASFLAAQDLLTIAGALLFAWIIGRVQAMQTGPGRLGERFA